jgi:hypothetical protein
MNSTFRPKAPEGFVLGLSRRDIERLERQLREHLQVLRAVFDLCREANPTAPGMGCVLSRQQIAARSRLSGMVVNRTMAWMRTNHVMFVRWRKHKTWEVRFDLPVIQRILAAPLPVAMGLIEAEAQRKLRQGVVSTPVTRTQV